MPFFSGKAIVMRIFGISPPAGLLFVALLASVPGPASAQQCLGVHADANALAAQVGVRHQGPGTGADIGVYANLGDRVGLGGGAGFGGGLPFSARSLHWNALFLVGLPSISGSVCAFLETEGVNHFFNQAFGLDWGDYFERWGTLGLSVGRPLGELGGFDWSWSAAPQMVVKWVVMSGTGLPNEGPVFGDEFNRWTVHGAGRASLTVRRGKWSLSLDARTLPRIGSDLVTGARFSVSL
jgi:hypothetical protein